MSLIHRWGFKAVKDKGMIAGALQLFHLDLMVRSSRYLGFMSLLQDQKRQNLCAMFLSEIDKCLRDVSRPPLRIQMWTKCISLALLLYKITTLALYVQDSHSYCMSPFHAIKLFNGDELCFWLK
jgi:hypothetical protein